jgi:hypothetical protein
VHICAGADVLDARQKAGAEKTPATLTDDELTSLLAEFGF